MNSNRNPSSIGSWTFMALMLVLADVSLASSGRAPSNRTGAPGHQSCAGCHGPSSPNGGPGSVVLDFSGLEDEYEPGQGYTITVTVADAGQGRFGFAMAARDADNEFVDVGTFSAGSGDTRILSSGQVGHRNAPRVDDLHTFTVNWQAPADAVGDVTFYVSGLAANNNNAPGNGDNVYTSTLNISEKTVAPDNLPPVLNVPVETVQATRAVTVGIGGVSVGDPDAAGEMVRVALDVSEGRIEISELVPGGLDAGDITGNGSSSVTVDGTLEMINATFSDPEGILYTGDTGYVGPDLLLLEINDNGHSGAGGALVANASIPIEVADAPSLAFLGFVNSEFRLVLNGTAGRTYLVEYSSDLETFSPLAELTLSGESEQLADVSAAGAIRRYYRARETGLDP